MIELHKNVLETKEKRKWKQQKEIEKVRGWGIDGVGKSEDVEKKLKKG